MKESPTAFAHSRNASFASRATAAGRPRSSGFAFGTKRLGAALASIPARLLVALILAYRKTLSPMLPAFLGPGCGCRFHPTCACYAMEAIEIHGAIYGTGLAAKRLLKCAPYHPGGLDPVPPRRVSAAGSTPRPVASSGPASA